MSDTPANRPKNRYESVMVAAREARRLNARVMATRIEPQGKVTTEAIRRAQRGDVHFTYEEARPELVERAAADIFSEDGESQA